MSQDKGTTCVFMRFGKRKYIEQFISEGAIYANHISHFKNAPKDDKKRSDKNENITTIHNNIRSISIDGRKFTDGIVNAKIFDPTQSPFTHIFCLSIYTLRKNIANIQNGIFIDEKLEQFGEFVVIIHKPEVFIQKIKQTLCNLGIRLTYQFNPVKYFDEKSYSGEVGIFKKTNDYAYQSEWRLAISIPNQEKPFQFNIGSLFEIACLLETRKLKESKININQEGKYVLHFPECIF